MALVKWSDDLKVNVKVCDEQHKKLIETLNQLHDAMLHGKSEMVLANILENLIKYVDYHFKTEEDIFEKYGYPEIYNHKREHEYLTKEVLNFKARYSSKKALISVDLMNFLKNWVALHISKSDKRYGKFLNEKGIF